MSKYTTTIREFCEWKLLADNHVSPYDAPGFINDLTKDQIHQAGRSLFPQIFPFYDDSEGAMEDFENKFIDHFYFYEIGQETIGQFKWYLEDYLNTRMPYYNQLFATQLASLEDAMKNYDLSETKSVAGSEVEQFAGTITDNGGGTQATMNHSEYGESHSEQDSSSGSSKDKQFPLNNNTIQEIGRTETEDSGTSSGRRDSGSDETINTTTTNNNTQTNNNSRNKSNTESVTSRTQGILSINKLQRTKEFRDLIFSINQLIFDDMKKNHLFFELW